jgi:hypothetical protein
MVTMVGVDNSHHHVDACRCNTRRCRSCHPPGTGYRFIGNPEPGAMRLDALLPGLGNFIRMQSIPLAVRSALQPDEETGSLWYAGNLSPSR